MKCNGMALVIMVAASLAFVACKSDKKGGTGDAGSDAGGAGSGAKKDASASNSVKDAGGSSASKDAGATKDAAAPKDAGHVDDAGNTDDAGSGAQNFHVPATGGQFHFQSTSGTTLTFDFPPDAAGKDITVTQLDPTTVSWTDNSLKTAFHDVIELGPAGTTFTTPVKVTAGNGALIALNFHDPAKPADPLMLSADGSSLMLTHFSTLGIVDANQTCGSTSGWNPTANDTTHCPAASVGAATTYLSYGCKHYEYCYTIEASCCVDPASNATSCHVGDKAVALKYRRSGSNGGQYLYCDLAGGLASYPYVQSITPATLTANSTNQMITITGTGLAQRGSVFTNGDGPIATTWVSDTQVTAIVPGTMLTAQGTLSSVGYVYINPNGTGACDSTTISNCDWTNGRSNVLSIPIQ